MRIYKDREINIPRDVNLTEFLHTTAVPLPLSHLIAKDSLTDRSLTLGQLRARAGRIANGLKTAYDAKEGDRWAVILPNCVEYIELFHALLWTGGVACPINHALKPTEIAHALVVSRPRFIFAYSESILSILEGIKIAAAQLASTRIPWQSPKVMTVINRLSGFPHAPDDFLSSQILRIPHYEDTTKRLASIHLSSGTTGAPKGVELTHYNFVSNCHQLFAHDVAQFHPNVKTVAFTPYVHIAMTTFPLFLGPWTGMMHHAMPAPFNLETFGALVASTQATSFQGAPSIALQLANTDITTRYDFSSAQVINCGGALMSKATVERLCSRAPWKIMQVYGMTEGAPYIAYQKLDDQIPEGGIGHLLPNMQAMLKLAGTSEDAPEGGPGELWIKGPNVTVRYCGVSDETNSNAFPMQGGCQWYNTGDICTIDKDGIVSVVGRTKELIKYKGFQVSPTELESHLNAHPQIVEAGVGALWDETQLTELPTAYVVLNPDVKKEETEAVLKNIHKHMDHLVSGYKKLRGGVWSVTKVPKNATGKITRKELRDHLTGESSLSEPTIRPRL